jgi:hypothetical protein
MRIEIPKPILFSCALLLAAHAVGFWQMVLLSRTLGVPLWMPYSTLAVVYSLLLVLLMMILRGKNWARITYTVIGAFGLLTLVGHADEIDTLGWLASTAKLAALALLFVPTSNSWFDGNSMRRMG